MPSEAETPKPCANAPAAPCAPSGGEGWRDTAFGPRRPGVFRIALTGGPSGGKTSLLALAREALSTRGWTVLVVNETSTEMRYNGVGGIAGLTPSGYQWLVTGETVCKERLYEAAAAMGEGPVMIVTDRGVLDGRAFMGDDAAFDEILRANGISGDGEVMRAYDMVVHLVTAADGAREHYDSEDPVRTEEAEAAVTVDRECLRVWGGHPNRVVVGNGPGGFAEKMGRALAAVVRFAAGSMLRPVDAPR